MLPSVLLMGVVAAGLVAWLIGRPLDALSRFVEALGVLGSGDPAGKEPLPERGPPEIRRAVRTVNAMQQRVRSLLEERGRLVSAVTRDLRAPLARMRLRSEYVDNARERDNMLRDIDDMESMLASLAEVGDGELAAQPRFRVDLGAMLEDLTREHSVARPEVKLHGVPALHYTCEPVSMREAFGHLLANAVTYGGCARVVLELRPDEVAVCVDDAGPGLPEEERENVFLSFYRLEPARARNTGGFGLGLARARAVVGAHGGEIRLTRVPGRNGTRARVSLPVSAA